MRALTVWSPWAALIVAGLKPYEYRNHQCPPSVVGQRIVIHSGKQDPARFISHLLHVPGSIEGSCGPNCDVDRIRTLLKSYLDLPSLLPLGCGIGTAIIGQPEPASVLYNRLGLSLGQSGPWAIAWPMSEPEAWVEPIPCRGLQGFWPWGTLTGEPAHGS